MFNNKINFRKLWQELVKTKQYDKIEKAIDGLKVELGGEYKAVKKLNTLQSYLSSGLERYQDIVEVPEAPEGVEYRNMGTQESQIFSKLKKRFCSGRKAFSEHGANALAKICVLSEKFSLEELEIFKNNKLNFKTKLTILQKKFYIIILQNTIIKIKNIKI